MTRLALGEAAGNVVSLPQQQRETAIHVENATLQYPIGPFVRGSVKTSLFKILGHKDNVPPTQHIDALKTLNLTIEHGERIGIIGANGSGKSTLLRALAGIYPLKTGSIKVIGTIGTLLETQLGFETEATGRENIYYRGVALGHSPHALKEAEEEIVEFAGLGHFIDLPMRTYSSGMYVRLGFAISTQFLPDVLLVDEVFGAGDALFANKAVERMQRMVNQAGIVMLASHDHLLVSRICSRVLWLNQGVLVRDGTPAVVMPQFDAFVAGKLTLD